MRERDRVYPTTALKDHPQAHRAALHRPSGGDFEEAGGDSPAARTAATLSIPPRAPGARLMTLPPFGEPGNRHGFPEANDPDSGEHMATDSSTAIFAYHYIPNTLLK